MPLSFFYTACPVSVPVLFRILSSIHFPFWKPLPPKLPPDVLLCPLLPDPVCPVRFHDWILLHNQPRKIILPERHGRNFLHSHDSLWYQKVNPDQLTSVVNRSSMVTGMSEIPVQTADFNSVSVHTIQPVQVASVPANDGSMGNRFIQTVDSSINT